MKRLLVASVFLSLSATAADINLNNLSKGDVKNVTQEFGGNFAHTAVAAPETDGLWGVEVGVIAGKTKSPEFSDVVDASGGKGSDFKDIYHGGIMARAHFPFDIFAELSYLPEQEFSDVKVKSRSFGLGWNVGGFFGLPLDVAVGAERGTGNVKFHQDGPPVADIELETKTTVMWVGVSKSFLFFTPYAKIGTSKIEGDLDATASILSYSAAQSEKVEETGNFVALGANLQFAFFKLGVEGSQIQGTKRASAKVSLDF